MMHKLKINKATDSEGGTLVIDERGLDGTADTGVLLSFYEGEAEKLERFLYNTLPGGTYDRLLSDMMTRKASLFKVRWGDGNASEPPGKPFRWDGEIVQRVLDKCHELPGLRDCIDTTDSARKLLNDSTLVPGLDGLDSVMVWMERFMANWPPAIGMTESERYLFAVNKANSIGGL
jgi:hypothetical protein